ncbi:hypothetical protein [Candidatus Berkiella aquae]|uniref:Sel1 repeat protein n=1 Tax=Candidatus Berkiella aquae TaxID=295108 RepID=A0A0Q9YJU5_9GAMM|nr:hypothetical protein [Candidatus Berkiella aquae]MCS5710110.1 hypothetical protein [Candidatus Berkiella aquae]
MRYLCTAFLLLALPLTLKAQTEDCKSVLAKFPKYPPESSILAKQVSDYVDKCKERPGAEDPDFLKNCIVVGMRSLAVSGNYVAAVHMAGIECEQGNEGVSKNWLGLIINNQNASEEERMLANQFVNGDKPLPAPMRTPGLQQGTINKY